MAVKSKDDINTQLSTGGSAVEVERNLIKDIVDSYVHSDDAVEGGVTNPLTENLDVGEFEITSTANQLILSTSAGTIYIQPGLSGDISIQTTDTTSADDSAGTIGIYGGTANDPGLVGGDIELYGGGGHIAGNVDIYAGDSPTGAGGQINISSGNGDTEGGDITITVGTGNAIGGLFLVNIPTADPLVLNQVWSDAGVLKISAGP